MGKCRRIIMWGLLMKGSGEHTESQSRNLFTDYHTGR